VQAHHIEHLISKPFHTFTKTAVAKSKVGYSSLIPVPDTQDAVYGNIIKGVAHC